MQTRIKGRNCQKSCQHEKVANMKKLPTWKSSQDEKVPKMKTLPRWKRCQHEKVPNMKKFPTWKSSQDEKVHNMKKFPRWKSSQDEKVPNVKKLPVFPTLRRGHQLFEVLRLALIFLCNKRNINVRKTFGNPATVWYKTRPDIATINCFSMKYYICPFLNCTLVFRSYPKEA